MFIGKCELRRLLIQLNIFMKYSNSKLRGKIPKWLHWIIQNSLSIGSPVIKIYGYEGVPVPEQRRNIKHTMAFWKKYYNEAGVKLTKKKARAIQENLLGMTFKLKAFEEQEKDES